MQTRLTYAETRDKHNRGQGLPGHCVGVHGRARHSAKSQKNMRCEVTRGSFLPLGAELSLSIGGNLRGVCSFMISSAHDVMTPVVGTSVRHVLTEAVHVTSNDCR